MFGDTKWGHPPSGKHSNPEPRSGLQLPQANRFIPEDVNGRGVDPDLCYVYDYFLGNIPSISTHTHIYIYIHMKWSKCR